jgi:exopolysaccharide production protein ExoQ
MANDGLVAGSTTAPRASWIDEAVFLAFLFLAFVGLTPFANQVPAVSAFGGVATSGAGDLARQLCYLAVLGAVMIEAARKRGFAAFSALPLLLFLLLAWCMLSASWSGEPSVSMRRAGLAVVLAVCAMLSVETIGANRALVLLRWVLLAVLIVNWLSIPLIPQARHLPGEEDPKLVGDWRGLYGHKNIAGSVAAMTAIVFLFSPRRTVSRRFFDIAVALAAIAFAVMTRSKSSLGLLAITLVVGFVYLVAWKRDLDRIIVVVAGAALAVLAVAMIFADQNAIMRLFADPDEFTGRTEIWQAEVDFIRDHALLGAGFGTFSDTGGISPLHNYVGNSWVGEASHGHNGYLQILVTTGVIGFVLAMAALIADPAMEFWRRSGDHRLKTVLFALFAFLLLHNLMETDFLEGDGVTWVAYLLMMAMLYKMKRSDAA